MEEASVAAERLSSQTASQVIREGKKISARYIFSLGCELPPHTPVENLIALTRAVNDFGWYE
jgi:uroporphyrinogen-III decarboxylase